ncbi:hypothetical protein DESC_660022 [Desulfosarcina cetonica]|nr:hypothetical protein DESC_660022 [Desulfosarcina cetonica]
MQYSAQVPAKAHLPQFHPDEQKGQAGRSRCTVPAAKGIAAHVRPEKKQPQDKGESADVVGEQGRRPPAAQQKDSLFGQDQAVGPGFQAEGGGWRQLAHGACHHGCCQTVPS